MINNQLSFYIYTPPGSLRQAPGPEAGRSGHGLSLQGRLDDDRCGGAMHLRWEGGKPSFRSGFGSFTADFGRILDRKSRPSGAFFDGVFSRVDRFSETFGLRSCIAPEILLGAMEGYDAAGGMHLKGHLEPLWS